MATITFDTLKFVETLENAGITREHASAAAVAVREAQETALADHAKEQQELRARAVAELDTKTEKAIYQLSGEMQQRFAEVDLRIERLDAKFDLLEQRTHSRFAFLQWMLGILIAGMMALVMRAFFFPALRNAADVTADVTNA